MGSQVQGRPGLGVIVGLLFCGGSLLLPGSADAQLRVTSKHVARTKIAGASLTYTRVGAARPLTLQVTGPGTLTLSLRKELDGGPRAPTLVRVLRDGRPVAKVRLAATSPVRLVGKKGRAGAENTRRITIPAGSHRVGVRVLVRGHGALVGFSFEPDFGDLPDLVSLTGPADGGSTDIDAIALVGLDDGPASGDDSGAGDPGDLDAIALVGLTPDVDSTKPDETDPMAALELVDLDEGPADSGGTTTVASTGTDVSVDTLSSANTGTAGTSGGLIGAPLNPDPPAAPGPGRMILGLRGVAARVGLGSGAVGGGVDLLYRPGFLSGNLLLGLSVDFMPQRLYREVVYAGGVSQRIDASIDVLPILLTGVYQLGKGRLRFWASAGAGLAWVSVGRGGESASALHPAGALAFGPALRLGPGHLTASVRLTASHGAVDSKGGGDAAAAMSAGTLAGAGLTLGYALEL